VPYQTLRQQCRELLEARRYDELQALLSAERERVAVEVNQVFPYIPAYLPRCLMSLYARLLPVIWVFAQNRPSLLSEEASLAHQHRRIEIIIEMEQKLLDALNRKARTLVEEARALERDLCQN
jgi:hypothetical protein